MTKALWLSRNNMLNKKLVSKSRLRFILLFVNHTPHPQKKKKIKVITGLALLIRWNLNLDQYLSMSALCVSDTANAYTLLYAQIYLHWERTCTQPGTTKHHRGKVSSTTVQSLLWVFIIHHSLLIKTLHGHTWP